MRVELLQRARVGLPSMKYVARGLGVSTRTLQRQLRRENVSFAVLTDEVRASLAREYLIDPHVKVTEVGYLHGFSEPSAFRARGRR